MTLIKNKRIETDCWRYLQENETISGDNTIISLNYWQENKDKLITSKVKIGLHVNGDTGIADFACDLRHLSLIAIHIPVFTDGRAYSLATLLRKDYSYTGEIRAVGDVLPDQALYLSRVGFNALEVANEKLATLTLRKFTDDSVSYQTG